MVNLDACLERLRGAECLRESELEAVCALVKEILVGEANLQPISTPVTVCGDIHGQLFDLFTLFRVGGELPDTKYCFLGDYVDRGHHSVEVIELLLVLKAKYPDRITLIRGNHESRAVTTTYGFYQECLHKYGNANAYRYCCDVFDYFNLGAIVDGKMLCLHGGISPDAPMIDQLRAIDRVQEIPNDGVFAHLMWDDPDDEIDGWRVNPRGAGFLYGKAVTQAFNRLNGIDIIARAHQVVMDGYKYHFDENVVTVWSVPNYCYRVGNKAVVMRVDEQMNRTFDFFEHTSEAQFKVDERNGYVPYFLKEVDDGSE